MDPELKKIIAERTHALPQNVKEALGRVDVEAQLVTIFRNNDLRVDQSGALETEVLLTILGIQPSGAFVGNIIKHVHVSKEVAEKIATEVNETIFKAIRMDMMSAAHETHSDTPSQPIPASTPRATQPAFATGATPSPAPSPISQAKLEGAFRKAPDTVVVRPSLSKEKYPEGSDPYREPIT